MFGDTAAAIWLYFMPKLFVSSSKPAFQESCVKSSYLLQPNAYETKHIYLVTLKLQLFSSFSVKLTSEDPLIKELRPWRDQVSEKLISLPTDQYSMTDQRFQRITLTTALRFGFLLEKGIDCRKCRWNYYAYCWLTSVFILTYRSCSAVLLCNCLLLLLKAIAYAVLDVLIYNRFNQSMKLLPLNNINIFYCSIKTHL